MNQNKDPFGHNNIENESIDDRFRTNDDYFTSFKKSETDSNKIIEEHVYSEKMVPAAKYIDASPESSHVFVSENIKNQRRKRKSFFKGILAFVCIAATILCFSLVIVKSSQYIYEIIESRATFATNAKEKVDRNSNELKVKNTSVENKSIPDVVKEVSHSVVSINIEATTETVFNQAITSIGAGSGIIFMEDDKNVYIATNNHVIQGATKVAISLDDETQVPASSVGSDAKSDLAVISVKKSDMQTAGIKNYAIAKIGDSDVVELGDPVVAIGNALGEGKSVTSGIISAKNKHINIDGKKLNVIQTDAAINQGNSGGALANRFGEVVGINTAKLSSTGIEGMGYSIPVNEAKLVVNQIMTTGTVERPYLGIEGVGLTQEMANMYGLPANGVYVANVMPASSASQGGIEAGDIIVGYGEEKIDSMEELSELISKTKVNQSMKVYILRDNTIPLVLDVTINNMNQASNF